ncbi:MAG TPA: hypothetical protein VGD86_03905 [Devosia sp.]
MATKYFFRGAQAVLQRVGVKGASAKPFDSEVMIELAGEMSPARRATLIKARDERRIDDEVMREESERMDVERAWPTERRTGAGSLEES